MITRITLVVIVSILPHIISAQLAPSESIFLDVSPVFSKTVTDADLVSATSLSDLYQGYPSSWIHHYVSTSITIDDGTEPITAVGDGESLSEVQRAVLSASPVGSVISLTVVHKDVLEEGKAPQEIQLMTTVVPKESATYDGGKDGLVAYLRNKALQSITQHPSNEFEQARISFMVDKDGQVITTELEESSGNAYIDKMLLHAIQSMGSWSPAKDKDARAISQKFVIRIGNTFGC